MKRYDQLTTTRFWALLLVLIYHGAGGIYLKYINCFPLTPILGSAPTAVSYLYVLSGFVMSLVYYRPVEKFDFKGYWIARFVRIYPLYIISFLLVCYYYFGAFTQIKPQKILANIFVLQAWWPPYAQSFNYASWSMTVEFFFYAVFPFFIVWAYRQSTRKLIWVSMGVWAVSQLIHFALWKSYFPKNELFIVYFPLFHLNSFILGVVGGVWFVKDGQDGKINQNLNLIVLFTSLLLIVGYIIVSSLFPDVLPNNLQPMSGLLAPFFVLLIITLAMDKTVLSSILGQRWLVVLGETSFALYILHVPVIWLYDRFLQSSGLTDPDYIRSITYLPLMILVGLVAYKYIDPPIRRWMKNIIQRINIALLIIDIVIIAVSVVVAFRFRFGGGREYFSYRDMGRFVFWIAFLFRNIVSFGMKTLDVQVLSESYQKIIKRVFFSTTVSSIVIAVIVYGGYLAGWFGNYPRSVFFVDWIIVFILSLVTRLSFRYWQLSRSSLAIS